MCGEKKLVREFCLEHRGSPPRVRGKDVHKKKSYSRMRITPACAGKSYCSTQFSPNAEDHPRVCGEKVKGALFFYPPNKDHPRVCGEKRGSVTQPSRILGSPPRVRGKVFCAFWAALLHRITPACAGKRVFIAVLPCQ